MNTRDTVELEKILKSTHTDDLESYLKENSEDIYDEKKPFRDYMRNIFKDKNIRQQDIFLGADIPERYGYKIISEEKHTRQRDVILRICYAAEMTLDETQRALRIYEMPELYAKIPRDAMIMIIFNQRPGSIIEVNQILRSHQMDPLRTSGVQE